MTRRNDDHPFRPTLLTLLKNLLALVLFAATPSAAQAKIFKLGADRPAVEIALPPGWETANAETGVEATAPGVYLSAELIDADDLNDATAASAQFLVDRKIVLKSETKAQKVTTIAGLTSTQNDWQATDPDGPTRVRISIVNVAKDKLLVIFYWRSEAGEKTHAPEVAYILDSIKAVR